MCARSQSHIILALANSARYSPRKMALRVCAAGIIENLDDQIAQRRGGQDIYIIADRVSECLILCFPPYFLRLVIFVRTITV
jgi:hypothetical protein